MDKEKNIINFYYKKNIEIVQGTSSHSFPKHSHNAFCIGIVTNGTIRLKVQEREYLLEKDEVYFIPPHIQYTISAVDGAEYEYIVICIYNNVQKYSNNSLEKYVLKDKAVEKNIINAIQKFKENSDECYFEDMILDFLSKYIEIDYVCKVKPSDKIILSAAEFIKDNLNESFNLQKLSDYTNITK